MHKSLKALLLFSILLTVGVGVMGLRRSNPVRQTGREQSEVDERQFPIAEAAAPTPATLAERIKKVNKEKKYGRYKDTIGPGVTVAVLHYDWPSGFPTLPVGQSDAVVIGEVINTKAHVTEDKSTVYSEFIVRVAKVIKDDEQILRSQGGLIVAERPGGRVRYPSGHISRFSLAGWGMPLAGRQYVLFLTRNKEEQTYHIVTGYELRDGRIFPLDRTTSTDTDFDAYINMDEAAFFKQLDAATASPSSAKP